MAGLAATAALADHFEQVSVLDRDRLRSDGRPRPGVPQSSQLHGLLAGGLQAGLGSCVQCDCKLYGRLA